MARTAAVYAFPALADRARLAPARGDARGGRGLALGRPARARAGAGADALAAARARGSGRAHRRLGRARHARDRRPARVLRPGRSTGSRTASAASTTSRVPFSALEHQRMHGVVLLAIFGFCVVLAQRDRGATAAARGARGDRRRRLAGRALSRRAASPTAWSSWPPRSGCSPGLRTTRRRAGARRRRSARRRRRGRIELRCRRQGRRARVGAAGARAARVSRSPSATSGRAPTAGSSSRRRRRPVLRITGPKRGLYWRATTLDQFDSDRWLENPTPALDRACGRQAPERPAPAHPLAEPAEPGSARTSRWSHSATPTSSRPRSRSRSTRRASAVSSTSRAASRASTTASGVGSATRSTATRRGRDRPSWRRSRPSTRPRSTASSTSVARASTPSACPAATARVDGLFADDRYLALWPYEAMWEEAQRLRADARTPYGAVVAIETWLRSTGGFAYDESPPATGRCAAARALRGRGQARLLPALRRRDGADAAAARHPGPRRRRLHQRHPRGRRLDRDRPQRPCLGRGLVPRLRLAALRPDAGAGLSRRDLQRLLVRLQRRRRRGRIRRRRHQGQRGRRRSAAPARAEGAAGGAGPGGPPRRRRGPERRVAARPARVSRPSPRSVSPSSCGGAAATSPGIRGVWPARPGASSSTSSPTRGSPSARARRPRSCTSSCGPSSAPTAGAFARALAEARFGPPEGSAAAASQRAPGAPKPPALAPAPARPAGPPARPARAPLAADVIPAVVIAAGLGTRLRPLTERYAKPVLPVDGTPVLAHLLRELAAAGVPHTTIVTGHLAEQVERFVGDGSGFGLEIAYARQGSPDGSAHAVVAAGAKAPYLVLGADIVFARRRDRPLRPCLRRLGRSGGGRRPATAGNGRAGRRARPARARRGRAGDAALGGRPGRRQPDRRAARRAAVRALDRVSAGDRRGRADSGDRGRPDARADDAVRPRRAELPLP